MNNGQTVSTFLGIAAAVVLAIDSHAADINVPGDQPTIQAGINAAVNGDEVVVAPGVYNEIIDLKGKAVALRSADGPEVTIIADTGFNDSVVKCVTGERPDTVIEGFAKAPAGPGAVNAGGFRRGGPCGPTEASRAPGGCPAGSPGPIPPCCGPIPGHRLARTGLAGHPGPTAQNQTAYQSNFVRFQPSLRLKGCLRSDIPPSPLFESECSRPS